MRGFSRGILFQSFYSRGIYIWVRLLIYPIPFPLKVKFFCPHAICKYWIFKKTLALLQLICNYLPFYLYILFSTYSLSSYSYQINDSLISSFQITVGWDSPFSRWEMTVFSNI
jgi:hypothetical protein